MREKRIESPAAPAVTLKHPNSTTAMRFVECGFQMHAMTWLIVAAVAAVRPEAAYAASGI